ncbi:MAG: DUF1566 domain-containing protein [Deltaproteobacteria bacterium]|nr:DUF1566 domain-containing protein [Deltaproteobacteria bacterium]
MRKNPIKFSGFLVAGVTLTCLLALSCVAAYAHQLPDSRPPFPCEKTSSDAGGLGNDKNVTVADTNATGELPDSRPLFPCEPIYSPRGRWRDNRDGTVFDRTTGLIWLQDAGWGGMKTWPDATKLATQVKDGNPASLTDGSKAGKWRLPTKDELIAITTGIEHIGDDDNYVFHTYLFTGVYESYGYWSSTTDGYGDAWCVSMAWGVVFYAGDLYTYWVWPVRDGK